MSSIGEKSRYYEHYGNLDLREEFYNRLGAITPFTVAEGRSEARHYSWLGGTPVKREGIALVFSKEPERVAQRSFDMWVANPTFAAPMYPHRERFLISYEVVT